MSRRLAIAIGGWTLLAWGGRIGLLAGGEGVWAWLRIGGSLLVGTMAVVCLTFPGLRWARRPSLLLFAMFTVVLWARSLYVNWVGSGSLPFKVVHSVLALGFFALAWWAYKLAGTPVSTGGHAIAPPNEGHGQEKTQSKATGLPEG